MRKKYLSALLFGAMITASTGTFTSCKDYDADIKNLQEQVDGIKNDENAVTTEELNSAINAAKADLNKQIADLQSKLESIEHPVSEDDITNLQSQIDDLKSKVSGLDDLKNRLSALETANKLFLEGGDFSAYKGLDKFINDEIVAALGENGAIYNYINNTVKSQILLEIKGGYEGSLQDIDDDLTALEQKYDALIGENGTIVSDINDLNLYMDAIKAALAGEDDQAKCQKLTELLQFVSDNKDALGSLLTGILPEGLKDDVEAIIKDAEVELNGQKVSIEEGMQQLGMDIEALKGMVKSIVFIPSYSDGKVVFSNIQFKKTAGGAYETKYMDNTQEVKFRVSPASAVAQLAENYEIKLYDDEEVKSRSSVAEGTNYSIVAGENGSKFTDLGNGLISIKLEAKQANSVKRAIALALEPKKKENVNNEYDNITSDYIIAETQVVKVADVYYDFNTDVDKTIYYNGETDEEKNADYSNGTWFIKLDGSNTPVEMSKYSLLKPEDFTLRYSLDGTDANDFVISNSGVVSLKQANISDVSKTVDVKSQVALSGWYLASQNNKKDLGTVEVAAKAIEISAADQVEEYNGTATQTVITVDMRTLLAANGFDGAFIDNILSNTGNPPTSETKLGVYGGPEASVGVAMSGDDLNVTLPVKAKSGSYNIVVSFASSTDQTKVNVTIPLTIKDAALPYKLSENKIPERWQGDVVTLNPRANGSTLVYSGYSFDSMFSWGTTYTGFDSYKAAIEALGGSVTVSILNHEGTNVSGYDGIELQSNNTLNINPESYRTDVKTSLTITATYGGATETVRMVIGVVNVSGSWKITTTGTDAQKTNFDLIFINNGESEDAIITNIEWEDALGNGMWKNDAFQGTYANANPAGFGVKYKVVSSDIDKVKRYIDRISGNANTGYYVELGASQKLKFKSASDVSFTEFTFQIIVEPYAPFGPIEGYDTAANTLTIKLKP